MSDIELVIKIDENTYNNFICNEYSRVDVIAIHNALVNGTPLEQEPCNDCISRQAVIEYIEGSWAELGHGSENELVCQDIKELPPVIPQPKWIPVSERLPEDGQNVLFCDNDDDIMVGYHVKGRPSTHFSQDGTYDDMKNVRAWMPLPEPYKAESE